MKRKNYYLIILIVTIIIIFTIAFIYFLIKTENFKFRNRSNSVRITSTQYDKLSQQNKLKCSRYGGSVYRCDTDIYPHSYYTVPKKHITHTRSHTNFSDSGAPARSDAGFFKSY